MSRQNKPLTLVGVWPHIRHSQLGNRASLLVRQKQKAVESNGSRHVQVTVDIGSRSVQMRMINRQIFLFLILATAVWLVAVEAWAHRDRGPNDPCRKQVGDSLLHLTLYQPQFNPDEEYCEEVPRAGKAVLVVDVTAGELRQVPISVEVLATGESGQSRTVLSLPPKVYERGVADSEMVFEEGSDYVARVMLELGADKKPQLLSFPIRVTAWYRSMIMPTLMVVGVLAFIAISVIRYQVSSRQQESSVGRMNVRRVAN